jgi:hypothetical protein
VSRFWDLIQLFDEKTTDRVANAENLFNNSVSSRFRQSCAGIIMIKCICHSLHLYASDGCKWLEGSECYDIHDAGRIIFIFCLGSCKDLEHKIAIFKANLF